MKKLILIVLVLILSGCSLNNGNNEIKKDEIDVSKYEKKYNSRSDLIELEDGILFDFSFVKKAMNYQSHYLLNYQDGIAKIMNSDDENGCNANNINKCTGSFESNFAYPFIFEDKFYYVNSQTDSDNGRRVEYLSRCDLDGTNRENVIDLKPLNDNDMFDYFRSYNMHRGKFYVVGGNFIHIYDLTLKNTNVIEYELSDIITGIYFYDDYAYVTTKKLFMDNELSQDLLKIDLDNGSSELIFEDRHIYFVDETNTLTSETNGDKVSIVLINHETKGQKVLFDEILIQTESSEVCEIKSVYFNVFKEGNAYIITKYEYTIDENEELFDDNGVMTIINMYDEQGMLLNEYTFDGEIVNMGVVDNQYYGIMNDKLYCLDLSDESSELVEILQEYEK